ncbi:MAG: MoxR family ATPase [Deltaproteobacteria bacterium]|nr:MoxR family ATPase [Deltaproteobacteria bacterium]
MNVDEVQILLQRLQSLIGCVVMGSKENTRLCFISFLVGGHVLLEGVPGVGKTLLARCFARSLGLDLKRVQCTPDLMPGDVIGANIFDFRTQSFTLTKGPIFTEFLLTDEINRTPPKTQSALLEAMQERSVTIDGTTHALSSRFMVMATQNPVEHEGTYPLPEAQLDRFLFQLQIAYPDEEQEVQAVIAHASSSGMPDLEALGIERLTDEVGIDALRSVARGVHLEPRIARYIVALARASRDHPSLMVGLSPRAATMLAAAARANAACDGRDFVVPDDAKSLILPVARHRVMLTPTAEMDDARVDDVISQIAGQVPAPH